MQPGKPKKKFLDTDSEDEAKEEKKAPLPKKADDWEVVQEPASEEVKVAGESFQVVEEHTKPAAAKKKAFDSDSDSDTVFTKPAPVKKPAAVKKKLPGFSDSDD